MAISNDQASQESLSAEKTRREQRRLYLRRYRERLRQDEPERWARYLATARRYRQNARKSSEKGQRFSRREIHLRWYRKLKDDPHRYQLYLAKKREVRQRAAPPRRVNAPRGLTNAERWQRLKSNPAYYAFHKERNRLHKQRSRFRQKEGYAPVPFESMVEIAVLVLEESL